MIATKIGLVPSHHDALYYRAALVILSSLLFARLSSYFCFSLYIQYLLFAIFEFLSRIEHCVLDLRNSEILAFLSPNIKFQDEKYERNPLSVALQHPACIPRYQSPPQYLYTNQPPPSRPYRHRSSRSSHGSGSCIPRACSSPRARAAPILSIHTISVSMSLALRRGDLE